MFSDSIFMKIHSIRLCIIAKKLLCSVGSWSFPRDLE